MTSDNAGELEPTIFSAVITPHRSLNRVGFWILIGAYGMVWTGGLDPVHTTWLLWGQGLFIASGLIWVAILIPIQGKQARMARGFAKGEAIPERYWRLGRQWAIWGTVATLLPLLSALRGNLRVKP